MSVSVWDRLAGGLVPLARVKRDVHVFDGTTYTVDVTWWRRRFVVSYHTPRHPRRVVRARAAEAARCRAAADARLAELGVHHPAG